MAYDRNVTVARMTEKFTEQGLMDRISADRSLAYHINTIKGRYPDAITPNEVIEFLENFDPTVKNAYVRHLARWYFDQSMRYGEDAAKATEGLTLYGKFKNRGLPALDKMSFQDFMNLADELKGAHSWADVSAYERDGYYDRGEALLVHNDDIARITIPMTLGASQFFGRNTRWCTTTGNGVSFVQYTENGQLLVIVEWKKSRNKWQLHETMFGDEHDEYIDADDELVIARIKYLEPILRSALPDFHGLLIQRFSHVLEYTGTVSFQTKGDSCRVVQHYLNGELHSDTVPASETTSLDKWVTSRWYQHGKLHRDDGPAVLQYRGDEARYEEWRRHGVVHREDGPATITHFKTEWRQNGKLHREDGPAVINTINGDISEEWYRDGKRHRDGGPAVVWRMREEWFQNGVRHCETGPAVIYNGGREDWYLNGKKTTPEALVGEDFFATDKIDTDRIADLYFAKYGERIAFV